MENQPTYQWLDELAKSIRTAKFFVFDGPPEPKLAIVIRKARRFPDSYKRFVLKYGSSKLFRQGSGYLVGVLGSPHEASRVDGDRVYQIGYRDESRAFFRETDLKAGAEAPVFEARRDGFRRAAESFGIWIERACLFARKRFRRAEWKNLLSGPSPFTEREIRVVAARRQFDWRRVESGESGTLRIEVHNGSELRLPYLSIGAKWPNGLGGYWLKVDLIAPGETGIVEVQSYPGIDATTIELFPQPDPEPEDRDRYWEFR